MELNIEEMTLEELERKKENLIVVNEGINYNFNGNRSSQRAVSKNGRYLKYVKNQTSNICLAAVEQNGFALQYVINQTPEICLAAIEQNFRALQYVRNQTPELCLAALTYSDNDEECLLYIRDLSMIKPHVDDDTKEIPDVDIIESQPVLSQPVFMSAKDAREKTDKNKHIANNIALISGLITKAIQESQYSIELRNCVIQKETIEFLENQGYSVIKLHPSDKFYDYKISWENIQ